MKFSLYLSFQVFSMCIELYVCIMLSLASLVPISSHINNSPLSSTYGDMTLLYSLTFISKLLPLSVHGYPTRNVSPKQSDSSLAHCGYSDDFFPQARWQNKCSPMNRMGAAVGVVHVVTIFVQRWMCSSTSTTFPNACTWTFNDELFQCNIATSSRARGDKLWQL